MIRESITKLIERRDLDRREAEEAISEIMEGKASDPLISAFLVSLRMKGETEEEIEAFASIMRDKSMRINPKTEFLVDTCGTGGDNAGTFNISTASAIVVAGAGVSVAKHGNKSVSSKCGSADILEELGVWINLDPLDVEKCIEEVGIGFMYAPVFHPSMRFAANARREMRIRTIFNILGPLTNPAETKCQLIGMYDERMLPKAVRVLKNLGSIRVIAVNGNGMDEITISGKTRVCELKDGKVDSYYLQPEDFGFEQHGLEEIKGGSPRDNAAIIMGILRGRKGAGRDVVLMNAAAAIMASGKSGNRRDAVKQAEGSIDSGNALRKLEGLKTFTNAKRNNK